MTSTLSVIALITRLRSTIHTAIGDAIYREKVSNQTHTFGFKQFVNARHEYNESFREGDLVFLGGKFTIDETKLLVSVDASFFVNLYKHKNNKIILIFFRVGSLSSRWLA